MGKAERCRASINRARFLPNPRNTRISIPSNTNLQQRATVPFVELQPEFSWHGGFAYWQSKLASVIVAFARASALSFADARNFFRSQLAAIQLVPYHSESFVLSSRVMRELASIQIVKSYVRDVLIPRAASHDCLVIVARSSKHWALSPSKNVLLYDGVETRSAHLSVASRGGQAILKFLLKRFDGVAA